MGHANKSPFAFTLLNHQPTDVMYNAVSRYPITTIREIETENYLIVLDALPEEMGIDESFDPSLHNIPQLIQDVERGMAVWFCARCRVIHKPTGTELGSDFLGGCY